ncbi:MAG: membrane protein insertion efficiency factor YidD [Firmicutes bacterium]|nr:membrane protein insertion efficiency factor YidD [Bacillota bacterium]
MKYLKDLIKKIGKTRLKVWLSAMLIMILMFDMSRMPDQQVTAKILLVGIRTYKLYISPRLSSFVQCKYEPSCSIYGYKSIEMYGAFWGSIRTAARICRCTPWDHSDRFDPP